MFVRFGKIFVVVALVMMVGGHWMLLQTVAWTTMLADNLQSNSFRVAMTKTFDGKHPCCLCKAIAAAKKSEKKTASLFQFQKMEFPLPKENLVLVAPSRFDVLFAMEHLFPRSRLQRPPTPPPRICFT
jgi:hypothetical protein